jgi:hypothetical protein
MKSLSLSFTRHIALHMLTKRVGDEFDIAPGNTTYTGKVLHRHMTPCGVVLIVFCSSRFFAHSQLAFWLTDCGNSGVLITGKHTNTHGEYREEDPDYAVAIREYERPFADADFNEDTFESLATLI